MQSGYIPLTGCMVNVWLMQTPSQLTHPPNPALPFKFMSVYTVTQSARYHQLAGWYVCTQVPALRFCLPLMQQLLEFAWQTVLQCAAVWNCWKAADQVEVKLAAAAEVVALVEERRPFQPTAA